MSQESYSRVLNQEPGEEGKGNGNSSQWISELCESAGDVPGPELLATFLDDAVFSCLDAGSIYMYVWAGKTTSPWFVIGCLLSTIIQLLVPYLLLIRNAGAGHTMLECFDGPNTTLTTFDDDFTHVVATKLTALVMSMYLVGTFTDAMKRSLNMIFIGPMLKTHVVAAVCGGWIVILSICFSTCATALLFVKDPDVQDILLNSIALNFLPDVDCGMANLVTIFDIPFTVSAKARLAAFAEKYVECRERQEYFVWLQEPFSKRLADRPWQEFVWIVFHVMRITMIVVPFLIFYVVECHPAD